MSNFDEVQSMATEQALREQNQLLRKQLEDMNAQMQALMAVDTPILSGTYLNSRIWAD